MSNNNNIELELRAEVTPTQFRKLLSGLNKTNKQISKTKRLSVMFLGEINKVNVDIRVRINSNNEAEIVIKRGDFHTHDRVEDSRKITKERFVDLAKTFSLLGLASKVTERENFNFDLGNNITLTLVKAGSIAYVEVEKMSNAKNLEKNKAELLDVIKNYNLKLIGDAKKFNQLCNRLTKHSDWIFNGSAGHLKKLSSMLNAY